MSTIVRSMGLGLLAAGGFLSAAIEDVRAEETVDSIRSPLGVVDNRQFAEAAAAGADWMRVPIQWKFIERGDDNFTFGAESTWLNELEDRNMHMSPVVNIGRCWASHRSGDEFSPTDDPETIADFPSRAPADLRATYSPSVAFSETYYDFIFTFVEQYGDRIDRLTIENEVNAANFWEDSIEDYLKVLATARKAAQDANPDVKVFDSGMGSGSWGAPLANDRYNAAQWTWLEARNWLREYYHRDVNVRGTALEFLWTLTSEPEMQSWFNHPVVTDNNLRVTTVLDNLYSDDLDMMLVDGLNLKFTGDPWLLPELVTWIDERIAAAGQPALPLKINNEASNWCVDHTDYISASNICDLQPGDGPQLADELVKKILFGLDSGIVQSVWFPLTNNIATNERTPRLGLYDYDGQPTEALAAFQLMGRFIGGNRDYEERTTLGNVERFAFSERVLNRDDVFVLYWDDGGHGTGTTVTSLPVPTGTVFARHYTADGDSIDLSVVGDQVTVTVTESPSVVYLDDGFTPIDDDVEPTHQPVPESWVLEPMPNPSSGLVTVSFGLPEAAQDVRVDIFDVSGRQLAALFAGDLSAGVYRSRWDGSDRLGRPVASGVYFVRLTAGRLSEVRRILINR